MSTHFPTMSQIQPCDLGNLIWVLLEAAGHFFFPPGLNRGRKQTLIYLRVFVCEPELVFTVALTYLPARLAFRV